MTKGSIEEGKPADLVVLSYDPLTTPADKLKNIKPLMTIIASKTVDRAALLHFPPTGEDER